METNRVVSLKDFTIGLVLALAEKEVLVIDTPHPVLHGAIESAYRAIHDDVEGGNCRAKFHAPLSSTIGESFEPSEIIAYALGARLMTRTHQGQALGVVQNECFAQAYFALEPTRGPLYRKAAQAFMDHLS